MTGEPEVNCCNQAITLIEMADWGPMSAMTTLRQRTEQSELGLEYRDYTCDMRVSPSLLSDSQDDGASPWDALQIVLQVPDATNRLTRYLAVGEGRRAPLAWSAANKMLLFAPQFTPLFGRSCGWVQRGIGSRVQAIVAWIMREEFHP